jgi:hypothetical protein
MLVTWHEASLIIKSKYDAECGSFRSFFSNHHKCSLAKLSSVSFEYGFCCSLFFYILKSASAPTWRLFIKFAIKC